MGQVCGRVCGLVADRQTVGVEGVMMVPVPNSTQAIPSPSIDGPQRVHDNCALKQRLFGPPPQEEVEPETIVAMPKQGHRGLEGIFQRLSTDYEGAPAFKSVGSSIRFIYVFNGDTWMLGDKLGEGMYYDNCVDPSAKHPLQASSWKMVSVVPAEDLKPDLGDCPSVIVVKSKFSNLHGGYTIDDKKHEFFPVFHNNENNSYLWHDLFSNSWKCGSEIGGGTYYDIESDAPHPLKIPQSIIDKIDAVEGFEAVTFKDVDPAYLSSDSIFTDFGFPPSNASLGKEMDNVEWIRLLDLNRDREDKLLKRIHAADLLQGCVGDCWLIAGFACAAEYPEVILQAFRTKDIQASGRYEFKLWDVRMGEAGEWVTVVIDDLVPCKKRGQYEKDATPIFCKVAKDDELWPCLLEKAFAKFIGSYEDLNGGSCVIAWQALAGVNDAEMYCREENGEWSAWKSNLAKQRAAIEEDKSNRTNLSWFGGQDKFGESALFEKMQCIDKEGAIISASISQSQHGEFKRSDGLVEGHAFSFLAIKEVEGTAFRLVRLRNPWGNGQEWNGAWSDESDLWFQNPQVEEEIEKSLGHGRSKAADGIFWMQWEDFISTFDTIYFLYLPGTLTKTRQSWIATRIG